MCPFEDAKDVLNDIKSYVDNTNEHIHMPIEVRFVPTNDAYLSMASDRIACYIGIIKYKPFGFKLNYTNSFEGIHNVFKNIRVDHTGGKNNFIQILR